MSDEKLTRNALRPRVLTCTTGAREAVDEFWVPRSNERADIAVIGRTLDAFEIKTASDTLRRLPRQVEAYGRLFDRCTLVVAEKHFDRASLMLPEWWGITAVAVNGSVTFRTERKPQQNPSVDPETLVRLLWRDEVVQALVSLGSALDHRRSRSALWAELLRRTSLRELRRMVLHALIHRDPARARFPTRRFADVTAAAGADR